jgi:hypothetical protein
MVIVKSPSSSSSPCRLERWLRLNEVTLLCWDRLLLRELEERAAETWVTVRRLTNGLLALLLLSSTTIDEGKPEEDEAVVVEEERELKEDEREYGFG